MSRSKIDWNNVKIEKDVPIPNQRKNTWLVIWGDHYRYFKTRREAREFASAQDCYAYVTRSDHQPAEFGWRD